MVLIHKIQITWQFSVHEYEELCLSLVFVPIIGMWAVHKYNWEHWEPFTKNHDVKRKRTERVAQTTQGED